MPYLEPLTIIDNEDDYNNLDSDEGVFDAYEDDYDEYAGSCAHDVMGYSDDEINDAVDGEPDAYRNID